MISNWKSRFFLLSLMAHIQTSCPESYLLTQAVKPFQRELSRGLNIPLSLQLNTWLVGCFAVSKLFLLQMKQPSLWISLEVYKLFLLCLTSTCFVLSPSRSIGVSWQKVLACFPSFLFFSLFAKNFPQRFVYWMKLNKQW